jgi:hypothetical protein
MRKLVLLLIAFVACATENNIRTVKNFRAARERGDSAAVERFVAPGARLWFESRDGLSEPFGAGGGSWDHWDHYFHAQTTLTDWTEHADGSVTATAHETNDFMKLLDWQPAPYTVTYWFDSSGRIAQVLIKSLPGKSANRLPEFKEWASAHHPEELAYLMPNGKLDPTGDRPERWRAILEEWRYGTKR